MSETLWYQSYQDGEPPRCRRLSCLPMAVQWRAAIDLATSIAQGEASARVVFIASTYERYWWWPRGDRTIPDRRVARSCRLGLSAWWTIPHRVVIRAQRLVEAATVTVVQRSAPGPVSRERIVGQLEHWRDTGHWRRIAARVAPQHAGPPKRRRGRKRRGRRPARISRGLP